MLDTNTEKDILKIKHPFKFEATFEFKTQWWTLNIEYTDITVNAKAHKSSLQSWFAVALAAEPRLSK